MGRARRGGQDRVHVHRLIPAGAVLVELGAVAALPAIFGGAVVELGAGRAPGDLRKVSLWLGHADMQTTGTYLRDDPTEELATVTAVVPMPGRRVRPRAPDKLVTSLHRRYIC
jgi:hypothetical protein